jgi:hypothetical protein
MNAAMFETAIFILRRFPDAFNIWMREVNSETVHAVFFSGTDWCEMKFMPRYAIQAYCDRMASARHAMEDGEYTSYYTERGQ